VKGTREENDHHTPAGSLQLIATSREGTLVKHHHVLLLALEDREATHRKGTEVVEPYGETLEETLEETLGEIVGETPGEIVGETPGETQGETQGEITGERDGKRSTVLDSPSLEVLNYHLQRQVQIVLKFLDQDLQALLQPFRLQRRTRKQWLGEVIMEGNKAIPITIPWQPLFR